MGGVGHIGDTGPTGPQQHRCPNITKDHYWDPQSQVGVSLSSPISLCPQQPSLLPVVPTSRSGSTIRPGAQGESRVTCFIYYPPGTNPRDIPFHCPHHPSLALVWASHKNIRSPNVKWTTVPMACNAEPTLLSLSLHRILLPGLLLADLDLLEFLLSPQDQTQFVQVTAMPSPRYI